jgi:hypothetical protein
MVNAMRCILRGFDEFFSGSLCGREKKSMLSDSRDF